MSHHAPLAYAIPEETVRVAHAAFPKGNLYLQMRDELGPIYTNHQFAALFSPTSQPAEDPARLALVLVMQFTELGDLPAVHVLRQVWAQQYDAPQPEIAVRWRHDADTPWRGLLIHSPFDMEARYSIKRGMTWVGYKAHLTETCDDDLPHVITHIATTTATTQDDQVTAIIHADLAAKQLLTVDAHNRDVIQVRFSAHDYGACAVRPQCTSAKSEPRGMTILAREPYLALQEVWI
jgi:hypothetical protein